MRRRIRLRERLLLSHLIVVAVGTITLFLAVGLVASDLPDLVPLVMSSLRGES